MAHEHHILVPAAIDRLHKAVAAGDAGAILHATRQMHVLVEGMTQRDAATLSLISDCLAATRSAEAVCAGDGAMAVREKPLQTRSQHVKTAYAVGAGSMGLPSHG